MATPTVASVVERLERDQKLAIWAFGVLSTWLLLLSVAVGDIRSDIKALKQNAKDHGQDIVKQIGDPTDSLKQRAALLTAAADLQSAKKSNRPPDEKKLAVLGSALKQVTKQEDPPAEVWPVISNFLTYRTASFPSSNSSDSCYKRMTPERVPPNSPDNYGFRSDVIGSCTIDLNDFAGFEKYRAWMVAHEVKKEQSDHVFIYLTGATVLYDPNRPAISLDIFSCTLCRLEVAEPRGEPSPPDRKLLLAMLSSPPDAVAISNTAS